MRKFLLMFLFPLILACVTSTAYQPISHGRGYSDTQLGDNIFQVSFSGNGSTSEELAADYALLRSAELASERGFRYFIFVESKNFATHSAMTSPTYSTTNANAYSFGNYAQGNATTKTYGGQTHIITEPNMINTIVCFKERPNVEGLVFDADFVSSSLRHKYGIEK